MLRTCSYPLLLLFFLLFSACNTEPVLSEQQVRLRLSGEPDGLSPILAQNGYSWQLIDQLFQPLMQFDPRTLELAPVLAKQAGIRQVWTDGPYAEGTAYTYEIREAARWDNGHAILASDYVFTLKCIFNPHIPNGFWAYLDFIKAVEIDPDNPRKFTVFCDQPYFLAEVATSNFEIYPEYAYDPDSLLTDFPIAQFLNPADREKLKAVSAIDSFAQNFQQAQWARDPQKVKGSGAYQLAEWIPGQRLVLQKKKNWWGNGQDEPMLEARSDRLHYTIIPDANAAISLLKSEQLDVLADIPAGQFIQLQENKLLSENYQCFHPAQLLYYYIALNRKNPKLEDQRVRRALAHVLNVPKIIEQVMYGFAEPTIGSFSPGSPIYNSQLKPIAFDADVARQLLAEAGWVDSNGDGVLDKMVNGSRLDLILQLDVSTGSASGKQMGLIFQENARKVGIEIQVQAMEASQLSGRLQGERFEMSYSARGNRPGEPDPTQLWYADKAKGGKYNYSNFGNATSDALIDSLRRSGDKTERYCYFYQLQELIYEDQPVLFVFVPQDRIAIHRRFEAEVSQRKPGYFPQRFKLKEPKY